MPANSADYQRAYRERTKRQFRDVSVRLPVAEYRELKAHAKENGFGIATVLREASLAHIRGSALRSRQVEEELRELRFLIANVANNLNQMAHHSNTIRHVADEGGVLQRLRQLDELVDGFVEAKLSAG